MPLKAKLYIGVICTLGFPLLLSGLLPWRSEDPLRFACYLTVAMFVAGLKLSLPGVKSTLSATFLFVLFGIQELTPAETMALACLVTAVQCVLHAPHRAKPVQVLFNVSTMAIAVSVTASSYETLASQHLAPAVRLLVAAGVFFTLNTFPVAAILSFTEGKPLRKIWYECYFWSFPYYLAGAAIAGLMSVAQRYVGWQSALLLVPVIFLIYRSYRSYLERLEFEKQHAEEVAALHLRTIEALALAIEAKDQTTHAHLRRVQVYAVEIAKELGISESEIEAVRAASLLHDIGKLAVPEHILSKPGRLTPEEFEKMKIHPTVGAEILDRVQFIHPVVPIVRSHHEKWNGAGYPAGLRGEEIPIGARILAAVDCLDAITSHRPYRRALPLEEAIALIVEESGKSFDPRVVEVLQRRYRDFQVLADACTAAPNVAVTAAPGCIAPPVAGIEEAAPPLPAEEQGDFLHSIAAARREVQTLFELAQDLGNSLSLDETLSVLAVRLRRIIPWDSMAIYVERDGVLKPEYASGDDFRLFSSLEIPVGHGVSGWVAANQKPILNGNPDVEASQTAPAGRCRLHSALAVPLQGVAGNLGVLTLYRTEANSFTRDHLRILLAISAKVALSIENALRFRQAESSATTDYLTGMPNARSLFLHLDAELARARRTNSPVTVLVCDLDGFKQVNDRHGHLEGNRVLRTVALGLKDACREYDYVARMGGDEFVVILPGLTAAALEPRLIAFREASRRAGLEVCGSEALGLSIGQAFFPEDGADAEKLLAEADRRMYKEKQDTRHRASVSRKLWDLDLPALPLQ